MTKLFCLQEDIDKCPGGFITSLKRIRLGGLTKLVNIPMFGPNNTLFSTQKLQIQEAWSYITLFPGIHLSLIKNGQAIFSTREQ